MPCTVKLTMENTWPSVSCDALFLHFILKKYNCYHEYSFYFYNIYLKNSKKEKFNELPKKTINNMIIYIEI